MVKRKVLIFSVVLLIVLFSVAAFYFIFFSKSEQNEEKIIMHVAYAGANLESAVYIAKDYGYFDKEGISVELDNVMPNVAVPGLVSGQYHIILLAVPTFVKTVIYSNAPVVLVGQGLHLSNNSMDGIVVRKGLVINKPEDFIGKKVCVPAFGSIHDIYFRYYLKKANVDISKVNMMEIPNPQIGISLKSGTVDACEIAEPNIVNFLSKGVADLYKYNDWIPPEYFSSTYTTSKSFLQKHPIMVEKFLNAIKKATILLNENPDIVANVTAKYSKVDIDIMKKVSNPTGDNNLAINITSLEKIQEILIQTNFVNRTINFSQYVDGRFTTIVR